MNDTNEIIRIVDYINRFIDFLDDIESRISFDHNVIEILKNLRKKINIDEVSSNQYLIGMAAADFSLLVSSVDGLYNIGGFPTDETGRFIWEHFTEAHRNNFSTISEKLVSNVYRIDQRINSFLLMNTREKENDSIRKNLTIIDNENKNLRQENLTLKNTVSNKKVVDLYGGLETENRKNFKLYRNLFIGTILVTVFIAVTYNPLISIVANVVELWQAIFYLDYKHSITDGNSLTLNLNTLKYFVFKLSVIVVGVTLSTYFLRLSSFYQGKYEQAKQTRLELEAFPDYASLLKEETAEDLRKELALKYFGKDIDKNLIEKNGDLVLEQTRVSTELVKASLDVVKATKPQ